MLTDHFTDVRIQASPQNTGYQHNSTQSDSSTPLPATAEFQRPQDQIAESALRDSLKRYMDNPSRYLPNKEDLMRLKDMIVDHILNAVRELLVDTGTESDKLPILDGTLSPSAFSELCRAVYKAADKEDLERILCHSFNESQLNLEDFLRVILTAALMSWIFDGHHDPLPTSLEEKSEISVAYEQEIASGKNSLTTHTNWLISFCALVYPEFHKQTLRKVKHNYVNKRLDRQPFVNGLVYRCYEGLKTFLGINLTDMNTRSMSRWYENLQKVFDAGLQLDLQVSLLESDIRFEWLRFGAPLDPDLMAVHGERTLGSSSVVRAALFPYLMIKRKVEGGKEKCLLRGIVILQ